MSLKPAFLNKLKYLLTVGYSNAVIKSFETYCVREVFDEDSVIDDLEELQDSSIMEHLQQLYKWNDHQLNDFYSKLRQSLDIIPKSNKKQTNIKKENMFNEERKEEKIQQEEKQSNKNNGNNHNNKMYISAYSIDYNLSPKELNLYKDIYFNECNKLLPLDQRNADEALFRVLAIGRKNNIPLLQNMADTYSRVRIDTYLKQKRDLTEAEFGLEYNLLRKMKRNQKQNHQYLQSALQSFHKRICPKIQFKPLLKINDSLADFFEYISATIKFIHNVVSQQDALPPFQIDVWIIPINITSGMTYETDTFEQDDDEDDEDDDDSDDDEQDVLPNADELIGDIESRLQYEKLIYDKNNVEYNSPANNSNNNVSVGGRRFERELDKKCKDFWKKNRKYNYNKEVNNDRSGAHKTRICIVIDRRKPKDFQTNNPNKKTWHDIIYIYSPPSNCNYIAENHTPESYFNASKQCMLPGKGYNNGKRNDDDDKMNTIIRDKHRHKNRNRNRNMELDPDTEDIEVGKPLGGYQFTLSFHVESMDNIKAYIFYQGWISRFFPQDMINIWPIWFSNARKENKEFINNPKKWKSRIQTLSEMLCDDQFKQWYKETTK